MTTRDPSTGTAAGPGAPVAPAAARVSEVVVRPALPADLPRVGELTARAYVADGLLAADHWYADRLRDAVTRAAHAHVLVATAPDAGGAERVVGTITLAPAGTRYAEVARPGEVELRMLAVDPGARRAGVAEQLVHAALRDVVADGGRDVVLSTLDPMRTAQRLYARLGFVARPARDWTDEVTMRVHTWHAPDAPGAAVEQATWPPPRVVDVDGWRVGLSGGVTRRAGSTLARGDVRDLAAAVDRVEEVYASDGGPATFRVGDPDTPAGLAPELDRRGYAVASRTYVLVRDLASLPPTVDAAAGAAPAPAAVHVRVDDAPTDAWLDLWLAGKGTPRAASRAIVAAAPARYLTAVDTDGTHLAVVRAAPVGDWVGVACLQVVPAARRRGLGRALTLAALESAAAHGARRAFLQVEDHNAAALRLYARLGFAPAQRYAYRVAPTQGPAAPHATTC